MEVNVITKEHNTFELIDDNVIVSGVTLCSKQEFMDEFDKVAKQYNGISAMIEFIEFDGIRLTFFETQLIMSLCMYGDEHLKRRLAR